MDKIKQLLASKNPDTKGFTIVEVLVATTVFSLILIMTIFVIIGFTHSYYKAVNSSTTQDDARTILNDVTQAIKFSGGSYVRTSGNTYCIGSTQFDFTLYNQPTTSQGALWDTPVADPGSPCNSQPRGASSQELVNSNIQVLKFQICLIGSNPCSVTSEPPLPTTYSVTIVLGYGPNSLICDTAHYPNCQASGQHTFSPSDPLTGPSSTFGCVETEGTQFCDVVYLTADIQLAQP